MAAPMSAAIRIAQKRARAASFIIDTRGNDGVICATFRQSNPARRLSVLRLVRFRGCDRSHAERRGSRALRLLRLALDDFVAGKRDEPPIVGGSQLGKEFGRPIPSGERHVQHDRTLDRRAPGDAIGRQLQDTRALT